MYVYSVTKQAVDQDPEGTFIRRWVPELRAAPVAVLHRPPIFRSTSKKNETISDGSGKELAEAIYPLPVVDDTDAGEPPKRV